MVCGLNYLSFVVIPVFLRLPVCFRWRLPAFTNLKVRLVQNFFLTWISYSLHCCAWITYLIVLLWSVSKALRSFICKYSWVSFFILLWLFFQYLMFQLNDLIYQIYKLGKEKKESFFCTHKCIGLIFCFWMFGGWGCWGSIEIVLKRLRQSIASGNPAVSFTLQVNNICKMTCLTCICFFACARFALYFAYRLI